MTDGLIPVVLAAVAASGVSWWGYARLEEAVPGRVGPAVLRGLAVFFVLAGWWLPPLRSASGSGGERRSVLVDRSLSMSLPASPGGISRRDSALLVVDSASLPIGYWFADSTVAASSRASGEDGVATPSGARTRLTPALEAARAAGADSVIVVTDGELDDREEARAAALRLGLGVREVRVGGGTGRLAIREVDAPTAVEAGDSIRFVVELATVGGEMPTDSASLSVTGPDGTRTIVRFEVPAPGRSARIPAGVVARSAGSEAWQAFDVRLEADADPIGPGERRREWVEIVPTAAGAVVVSVDPDWEPHFLLPVLRRSTAGGARAWLRVGADRWIRSGTDRMPTGDDDRVRRDAARAELLVIQGTPGQAPEWLTAIANRHPRVLWLARGPGRIPGSDVVVGEPHPGEWYPGGAPLSSPVAGFLDGLDHPSLPPAVRLFRLEGYDWAPFELRRNRAGAGQPPIGAARVGGRRRVVVAAEGLWRWASRAGSARQAYRSVFAGLAGWLLEAPEGRPIELESTRLVAGDTVRWNLASGVTDLRIAVRDSSGAVAWADTLSDPGPVVVGPAAPPGSLRFEAEGVAGGEPFRAGRPFEAEGPERELAARAPGLPLGSVVSGGTAPPPGGGRPVWPFVLAGLMLCGEWVWRRRIGLR